MLSAWHKLLSASLGDIVSKEPTREPQVPHALCGSMFHKKTRGMSVRDVAAGFVTACILFACFLPKQHAEGALSTSEMHTNAHFMQLLVTST